MSETRSASPVDAEPPRTKTPRHRVPVVLATYTTALALLALSIVLSFAVGAKFIPPLEVAEALFGQGTEGTRSIVRELRLNRTVLGIVCGLALGAAGVLMQSLSRNPIADPGILGVNAGAALGVVIGIVATGSLGIGSTVWFAMTGAAVATTIVFVMSTSGTNDSSPVRLTLCGVALSAVLAGITQAFIVMDEDVLDTFRFWQIGSLTARPVDEVLPVLPLIGIGAAVALLLCRSLNALSLGDDSALSLGVNPVRLRITGLIVVTILCGSATALVGPISFVGLIVPHLVRLVTGPDNRLIMPLSMLIAPSVLLLSDVLGRIIGNGAEVSVGIVTAFVGAPVLIAFISRTRRMSLA